MAFLNYSPGKINIGKVNLPDFGVSEKISSVMPKKKTNNTSMYTSGGASRIYGPTVPSDFKFKNDTYNTSGSSGGGNNGGGNQFKFEEPDDGEDRKKQELGMIEDAWSDARDFFGRSRKDAQNMLPFYREQFTKQYDAQRPMIEQARDEGINYLNQASSDAQLMGENALGSARNLYNELSMRNQQMFGGGRGSSVGQAASELLGREQMGQMGNIRQGVMNQVNEFAGKIQVAKEKANAQLQSLESQKQAALAQAELQVQNMLQQINEAEFNTGRDYSAQKLSIIQNYNNRAAQISDYMSQLTNNITAELGMYEKQFADQLALARQYNNDLQLEGENDLESVYGMGTDAVNNINSRNQVNAGNPQMAYNPFANFRAKNKNRDEDAYSNAMNMLGGYRTDEDLYV